MSDDKDLIREKPKSIWNTALKAVRGDDTKELVEQFTGEMTLVAEGLYEDQRKLRQELVHLNDHVTLLEQRLRNELEVLDTAQSEHQRDMLQSLDDIRRRLDLLEGKMKSAAWGRSKWLPQGWLGGVILLASIVCGSWVLVTILRLFR